MTKKLITKEDYKTELAYILHIAECVTAEVGLPYLGTESLLYAIATRNELPGCAAMILAGVDVQLLQTKLKIHMRTANRLHTIYTGKPTYTNAATGLFALAAMERYGDMTNEIASAALILAILKSNNTAAARMLTSMNLTYTKVIHHLANTPQ